MSSEVTIVEVAPRDGFQAIAAPLPTADKVAAIRALAAAGFRRIEIGSFVSPRAVPQMADMAAICEDTADLPLRRSALVPNAKGAELARRAGIEELVFVLSASEAHNKNNVNRTVAQSLTDLWSVAGLAAGPVRVDIATAWDCPFDGAVPQETVRRVLDEVLNIVPKAEIALCDTTGRAAPAQVEARFRSMPEARAFHGHDTYGMGVASALAAHAAGVTVFDAAAAGLGGCPFAPGATGNTATEDLVFAFHGAGRRTGVEMAALLEAADRIAALPGGITGGHLRIAPRHRAVA